MPARHGKNRITNWITKVTSPALGFDKQSNFSRAGHFSDPVNQQFDFQGPVTLATR
jgi:hypothetical protein